MSQNVPVRWDQDSDGGVVIHVERERFAEFVGGLLGQPQTIERYFTGPFDFDRNNVVQLHHLITQRVQQQNEAHLVQATFTILFSNDSSVQLNTLEDFLSYQVIGSERTTGVHAAWTYIVQFQDRAAPEKQVIEVTMNAVTVEQKRKTGSAVFAAMPPGCRVRIEHTARTWGTDIENLVTQHIQSWQVNEGLIKRALVRFSSHIGIVTALVFMALVSLGFAAATFSFEKRVISAAAAAQTMALDQKLGYLITALSEIQVAARPDRYSATISLLTIIAAVVIGIVTAAQTDQRRPSFVVISDADQRHKDNALRERRKGFLYFLLTGLTATVSGVASRYLFMWWFGGGL
jgi:hypothetical protein